MKHYVYRITNTILNKHYYGTRSADYPKDDIGVKYFSSSKDKDFIKDQKENPQDYKYKVVNIFDTREEAIQLEIKLHARFDVGFDKSGTDSWNKGLKDIYTDEALKKMSIGSKGLVVAKRLDNGKQVKVKKSIFDNDSNLVGITSDIHKGANSGMAKVIHIFNKDGVVVFKCNGDLRAVCDDNLLPYNAIRLSYTIQKEIDYSYGKVGLNKFLIEKYSKFNGWYAIEVKN